MKPLFPDVFVNGTCIASAEIAAEAQNHSAPKDKPGLAWRGAARALVVRTLLLQAAAKKGLHPAPAKMGHDRVETSEEALIRAFLEAEIVPEPVADPDPEKTEQLEKVAWVQAANTLITTLIDQAEIAGFEMQKAS